MLFKIKKVKNIDSLVDLYYNRYRSIRNNYLMKKYFISVDLEGVHGAVGEPYIGFVKSVFDYPKAIESVVLEINTAVRALFNGGADEVYVWDGHGGGNNFDPALIDPRAKQILTSSVYSPQRFDCLKDQNFDGVIFIGYHAREGTGGVLAHTYTSVNNQYIKINGVPYGEFELDCCSIGALGVPALFACADDVALSQIQAFAPEIVTVITKYAKGRNSAIFREREDVLKDIYEGVQKAMHLQGIPRTFNYPCDFEIRYTRMEYAASQLQSIAPKLPCVKYGEDLHVLKATLRDVNDLRLFF